MNDNKIYKDCSVRMSNNGLANFMYALIMCKARIVSTYGVGIDRLTRKQNAYNHCHIRIELPSHFILQFEEIANVKLEEIERAGGCIA